MLCKLINHNSGVYFEPLCNSTNLDHAVLAVGYGTSDKGEDFWLVKNSWSSFWGEQGKTEMVIKLHRSESNQETSLMRTQSIDKQPGSYSMFCNI